MTVTITDCMRRHRASRQTGVSPQAAVACGSGDGLPWRSQARQHGYAYFLLTMALCVTVGILPTYFGPAGRLRAPKRRHLLLFQ